MLAVVEPQPIGNVEAEAMLLGGLMQANSLIDQVADKLRPEDFAEALHGRIFAAIVSEHGRGRPVSPITLKPHFVDDPSIGDVGGVSYLAQLTGSGAEVLAVKGCAAQISELAQRRTLLEALAEAARNGRDFNVGTDDLAAEVETALSVFSDDHNSAQELTAAQCVSRIIEGLNDQEPGVRSGIGSLDATLGPIRKRNLVIVGGRPGMGKSALASSYALGAASRGHGCLFISLEMSAEELGERMASDLCFDGQVQVPYSAITSARASNDERREMARAAERIRDLPLTVIDIGSATLAKLNALVRRHKRRFAAKGQKLELVIVDYLQLVSPDHREQSPYAAVSMVSRGLKALAKTHDVGVMALTQLSRKVEERADKRPHMADLRDSGQIEQDADAILFLYAAEYYLLQCEDTPERELALERERNKIEFIVAKRRRGAGGVGIGRYYRQFQAVRG